MATNSHIEGRSAGAGRGKLSRAQMLALLALAREAFAGEWPPSGETFDAWRHRQTLLVTERAGFRACRNEDYLSLKQHFLHLCGRDEEAQAAGERAEREPVTWAKHALETALTECAATMPHARSYAAAMLRRQGMDFENATPRAMYRAMYTVRRKAGLAAKKSTTGAA